MKGFIYQLKLISRDKMCIITFFLPLVMALGLNLLNGGAFAGVENTRFAVLDNEYAERVAPELEQMGAVSLYGTEEEIHAVIADPRDDTVGVVPLSDGLRVLLAGDENTWTTALAGRLEAMLGREVTSVKALPTKGVDQGLLSPLIALVLVMALFLGLTFNTMNLVAEKEDGIVFVNEVLPLSRAAYLFQKIIIGFLGSVILTLLAALICFPQIGMVARIIPMTIGGSFVASVAGMLIGRAAENLMVSIVYMKVVMLVFMALPMVVYMLAPPEVQPLFHLLPSYTFFTGVIYALEGGGSLLWMTGILLVHALLWLGGNVALTTQGKRKARVLR